MFLPPGGNDVRGQNCPIKGTHLTHRLKAIELINEAHTAGAGLGSACSEIGICLRTLKRWRKALIGDSDVSDDNLVEGSRRSG